MPYDRDGHLISPNDIVNIPCKVISIITEEEYCNLTLESIEPMYPTENKSTFVVNSRQVELKNIYVPLDSNKKE